MDQLASRIEKEGESSGNLLRLVSQETLQDLVRRLARLHESAPLPSAARYGMPDTPAPATPVVKASGNVSSDASSIVDDGSCQQCGGGLSVAEASYCRANAAKFGSKLLCRGCQRSGPTATVPQLSVPAVESASLPPARASKYTCSKCSETVDQAVARFCWLNKQRFGGRVYCREHQMSAAQKASPAR